MELKKILELPVMVYGTPDETLPLKDFLYGLNELLLEDPDSFSGKRPYGNSGWKFEIYKTFIKAGLVPGKIDSAGYLKYVDKLEAYKFLLNNVLKPLFHQTKTT